jgi:hypothetical protein
MSDKAMTGAETDRLAEDRDRKKNWKRWGPYLSERQWSTVREDYSANSDSWGYFPHDHARSRAYRWGEDGILGICDRECRLCFALALWNGKDPILKERLFGLTGPEGNHGEDIKEVHFHLDSSPTHTYMKGLYKYPHNAFPYDQLVSVNAQRNRDQPEFEITDTGIFDDGRYFDITIEYAKQSPDDILIRITAANRANEPWKLHLLPTIWYRNTWGWGRTGEGYWPKGRIAQQAADRLALEHQSLGRMQFAAAEAAPVLVTDNETNTKRLYNFEHPRRYCKDAFNEAVVHGRSDAVCPDHVGSKAAFWYQIEIPAEGSTELRFRLWNESEPVADPFAGFDDIFKARIAECDDFYNQLTPTDLDPSQRDILRHTYAGLLWTKQFYDYAVHDWLCGDPGQPLPPPERWHGRNSGWSHLFNRDVLSMPDSWEYPWYAAWDLSFHMIPFAHLDPTFSKEQLVLMLREWYMHPNGQLPAYEFSFSDANPPVHAWACWRAYKIAAPRGSRDKVFLARTFQKLLLTFTWWVNRKDIAGQQVFSGGFLGLDNIGVFDRSKPLPGGGQMEQADGTAWMAFFCATMLSMAVELADDPAYEDMASKFFEHFVEIADAMNTVGGVGLWDEDDGFYYDQFLADGKTFPLRLRSMVGLIPLVAVEVLEPRHIERLPAFRKRLDWFLENRKDLQAQISWMTQVPEGADPNHQLLAIPSRERLERVLRRMLDEGEFLSPFGIRSLSKVHAEHPFILRMDGQEWRVDYEPSESRTGMFGGNSNWRGPIWFPMNYLLIESLEKYHRFYGDSFKVECPTGSGNWMTLDQVAGELNRRLASIFALDENGKAPWQGWTDLFTKDPHWRGLTWFHEYFDAETGRGCGASHQTGWTALVARSIVDCAGRKPKT